MGSHDLPSDMIDITPLLRMWQNAKQNHKGYINTGTYLFYIYRNTLIWFTCVTQTPFVSPQAIHRLVSVWYLSIHRRWFKILLSVQCVECLMTNSIYYYLSFLCTRFSLPLLLLGKVSAAFKQSILSCSHTINSLDIYFSTSLRSKCWFKHIFFLWFYPHKTHF